MAGFMMKIILGLFMLSFLSACSQAAIPTTVPPTVELVAPTLTKASKASATLLPPTPTVIAINESDRFAYEQNARLGRGVNLGNALESVSEGDWGVTLEEEFFDLIQQAGFDSVRVPIRWNAHAAETPPYTIDPVFFDRIDWVVKQAERRNLAVILNIHHYEEMMEESRVHKDRFLAIWEQIAVHYKTAPDSVYFELLNEPFGTLAATTWNQVANEAIQVIRKSNPQRTIILGPGSWNSISNLYDLQLPLEDRNLIVTVHYYLPFQFTHQGAEWVKDSDPWLGTEWNATPREMTAVHRDLDAALKWSQQNSRPIFVGEFGAYSKADMDSRHRWTGFMASSIEERGFSWAYWEFCAGFGVYDRDKQTWNEPILTALIPGENK